MYGIISTSVITGEQHVTHLDGSHPRDYSIDSCVHMDVHGTEFVGGQFGMTFIYVAM